MMNDNPLFSIVVPVYNVENYLQACLDSVLKQTYRSFEVILVDDGSTDQSVSIAQKYVALDKRIKLFLQANKGVSAARNRGLKEVTGQYVVFLDSDDLIHVQMLEKVEKIIANEPDKDMIQIRCEIKREVNSADEWEKMVSKPIVYNNNQNLDGKSFYIHSLLTQNPIFGVWNFVYKKRLLDELTYLFLEGVIFEDTDFIPRALCQAKSVWVLDEICYIYRIRSMSIMTAHARKSPFDFLTVLKAYACYFSTFDLDFRRAYAPFLYAKCLRVFPNAPNAYYQQLSCFIKSLKNDYPLQSHSREARLIKMISFLGVKMTLNLLKLRYWVRHFFKI